MSKETGYFVLKVAIRDGENEYIEQWAVILDIIDNMMPIDKWLKKMYNAKGKDDWKEIKDDYRLVCMRSYSEVTEEEFYILKKYL
tara:strand:+ start:135 stop:389 length:255 start_codon:yes stop_codon:yes gene_type:complete